MSASLKERLLAAIAATPPEKRGHVLREASVRNTTMSLTDLLTDLAPFVEAEIRNAGHDVAYYKRREAAIIAAVGPVCDGGQYVNDIVSAVERMRRERDGAHALLDKHGALTHMIGTGSIENQRATLAERIHDLHCMAAKDAADLRAEIAALQARIDLLVADEPTGAYQEGLAAGRRESQAGIARLNADLARLGALKTEEVAGVLERFRAAFGVNVPPAPQDLEVCDGDKCETCVNYEIERREAINRERWAQTFPNVPWIADEQDRTNYLLNEHDRASGKMET